MSEALSYRWIDRGRDSECPPDPAFPDGKDVDVSLGAEQTCSIDLPHPTLRCGLYIIQCSLCWLRVAVTTAGRPDDPRSVKVGCHLAGTA